MEKWYLYIVRCRDGSLYTGVSKNVEERVKKHNQGKGAAYTNSRKPVELVYVEEVGSYSTALKREAEIKRWPKSKKESLIGGYIF
jgi:putative endonuclease